jgi:polyferredoxin
MRPFFRLTTVRIVSQLVFLGLFVFVVWATWTTRMQGYPVSRFLEIDPLVALSTLLSTGHIYRYLGWSILLLLLTLLFGRLFCNWICPLGTLHQFAGWLFNVRSGKERQEQNRYHPRQVIKYVILIIVLIISVFGSVQIGLLDPLALLHRSMVTGLSTGWDWLLGTTSLTQLQLAPGTAERIYTGSLWIGVMVVVHYRYQHLAKPLFLSNPVSTRRVAGRLFGIFAVPNSPGYGSLHQLRSLSYPL